MPVYDAKTGRVKPRRAVRGCAKLCKGFHKPKFKACVSTCLSVAQTGQRKGFSKIPGKSTTSCQPVCPKAGKSCLAACFRKRLHAPKRRERAGERK